MAKKKKAAKGGGTNSGSLGLKEPKKPAAKKASLKKAGEAKVQQGIGDVLDPRDDDVEQAYQEWAAAKKAHISTGDKVTESYDALKALMREKDITVYRLHCVARKRLRFKPRDAEVKEETVKENNGSDD